MVSFDDIDAYRVVELIEQEGGETTLGRITEALGGEPRGLAIAQAMIVRRLLSIDLTSVRTADSRVLTMTWHGLGRAPRAFYSTSPVRNLK